MILTKLNQGFKKIFDGQPDISTALVLSVTGHILTTFRFSSNIEYFLLNNLNLTVEKLSPNHRRTFNKI